MFEDADEMKPSTQAAMTKIEDMVKAEFAKDPGEYECWEDMFCWVVAYFTSEDWADLSTKEMARVILAGWTEVNIFTAREYFVDQMEVNDDPAEDKVSEETRTDVIERVECFLNNKDRDD